MITLNKNEVEDVAAIIAKILIQQAAETTSKEFVNIAFAISPLKKTIEITKKVIEITDTIDNEENAKTCCQARDVSEPFCFQCCGSGIGVMPTHKALLPKQKKIQQELWQKERQGIYMETKWKINFEE